MADEDKRESAEEHADDAAAAPEDSAHAVPTEQAQEIAGSAEDAPLEALQEAQESPSGPAAPQVPAVEAAGEGHAVPSEDAMEIAGSAEDAPLEALQEAEDQAAEAEATPREKPAVPGAHLEVDIVPEGVDPLGRAEAYEDPYAIEDEAEGVEEAVEEEVEEALVQPIATAAIDLASGARYRATGKRKTAIARVTLRPGSGSYVVNGRSLEQHFPRLTLQRNIRQPLETVGYEDRMDVVARLHGGGISAQAGALRHGV
ncbi:MAG TPA: 30S ribosomal protein S9, partial [Solirubrobacteraceae bacterium]|nr:30S ribosomal protein S9 [Solirubrobacteraceae bacterium]